VFILLATTQINELLELEATIQSFRTFVRSTLHSSYKYKRILLPWTAIFRNRLKI